MYRKERSCALAKRGHRRNRPTFEQSPATSRERPSAKLTEVRQSATELLVRKRHDGALEFIHPRCAAEREDDIRAARAMVAEGELDVARDELRWLLHGCSDNMAIHVLLGELAAAEADYALARGHFGYAYQIGQRALRRAGLSGNLHADLPANRDFFAAGKGLVQALIKLGKRELAEEVVQFLVECDPRDPTRTRELLTDKCGGDAD
jgi:hypothetical protein